MGKSWVFQDVSQVRAILFGRVAWRKPGSFRLSGVDIEATPEADGISFITYCNTAPFTLSSRKESSMSCALQRIKLARTSPLHSCILRKQHMRNEQKNCYPIIRHVVAVVFLLLFFSSFFFRGLVCWGILGPHSIMFSLGRVDRILHPSPAKTYKTLQLLGCRPATYWCLVRIFVQHLPSFQSFPACKARSPPCRRRGRSGPSQ